MSKLTLDRILQSQGFGTRKGCAYLISQGDVRVNDQIVTDPRQPFETTGLVFEVMGEAWHFREHVYLALHKPPNVECSRRPSHHISVLALLPEQFRHRDVQPVGRLDHDTTGLLLLSDDGGFIHRQSSPKHHVPKHYIATTAHPVTEPLINALLAGVQLIDEPAPLRALHCHRINSHQIEIVLTQGKYHQVKRMLAAAGNHCAALHRSQISELKLNNLHLNEGQWCYLESDQLALLDPAL